MTRVVVHDYAGHAFSVELGRELAKRGHEVLYLYSTAVTSPRGALTRSDDDAEGLAIEGVALSRPLTREQLLSRRRLEAEHGTRVARRLHGFRPDVVLSANAPLESQRRIVDICRRDDIGFVFWVQDLIGEAAGRLLRRRLHALAVPIGVHYRRLEQQLLREADEIVVISEDFLPYVPRGAHVVENWAPLRDLPVRERRNQWGEEHGDDGALRLLYSGTLGMKHDPSVLLRLSEVAASAGARVVVVSEGSAATWLAEQAGGGRHPNLTVLPFQPYEALPDMLASADVLVAILEPDAGVFSVPSKVLSYLCAQRPLLLVVPPLNLAARVVDRIGAGIVVPPGDTAALERATIDLLADAETRQAMGLRARRYAEETFDLDAITTSFESILTAAVAAHRRPAAAEAASVTAGPADVTSRSDDATLSVVIVTFNSVDSVDACLRSLAAERDSIPLEVLVVDNASVDGTADMIAERFPWVRLVRNTENTGFARAANRGLAEARWRHILLLNPDTVVYPGSLSRAVDELDRHPDVGMLGAKLVRADGTIDHACKRGLPTVSSALLYLARLHRLFPRSPTFAAYVAGHVGNDEVAVVDAINGAFMLVRREAVEAVGPFDERFWLYGEDLDWCERFAEQGWKILYWPRIEVVHLKGASKGGRAGRAWTTNVAFHRSMWLYYDKHLAGGQPRLMGRVVWASVWARCGAAGAVVAVRRAVHALRRGRRADVHQA